MLRCQSKNTVKKSFSMNINATNFVPEQTTDANQCFPIIFSMVWYLSPILLDTNVFPRRTGGMFCSNSFVLRAFERRKFININASVEQPMRSQYSESRTTRFLGAMSPFYEVIAHKRRPFYLIIIVKWLS